MPLPPYPIIFEPILKQRVWGGRGLSRFGKTLRDGETIGESWELADLPDAIDGGRSVIANGSLAHTTLHSALRKHQQMIMGAAKDSPEGGFPLLLKYLDARQNLSVQVHPTPEYVRVHPDAHLKSEAWVVIEAQPGAVIYKGVKPGITPDRFAEDIRTGAVVDDLVAVPVKPGDCHYLPSGTCHALGAGLLVAEVQTPSDTTFRVYDWGRTARTLHIEQALACIDFDGSPAEVTESSEPIQMERLTTTRLHDGEFFSIERVETLDPTEVSVVTNGVPVIWMVTSGRGRVCGGGVEVPVQAGSTVLWPAAITDGVGYLGTECSLLRVTPPSPIAGLIA